MTITKKTRDMLLPMLAIHREHASAHLRGLVSVTADWMRHGYGADALAFRFNRNGVLIVPPAYIAQEDPNDFYTRRIGSVTVFRATVHDVEAIFGRAHSFAARPDGFMWYYAIQIYNAFEEHGGCH